MQRTSLPSPNRSRVGAKLTKASIDLRRGGVAPATKPRLRSFFNYVAAGRAIAVALIDNHPEHRRKCQNYQTEDHPQGEQFYTAFRFSAQCGLRTAARRAEMTHVS